jgi:hypothetical protein
MKKERRKNKINQQETKCLYIYMNASSSLYNNKREDNKIEEFD